jgi:hypothetical protein
VGYAIRNDELLDMSKRDGILSLLKSDGKCRALVKGYTVLPESLHVCKIGSCLAITRLYIAFTSFATFHWT